MFDKILQSSQVTSANFGLQDYLFILGNAVAIGLLVCSTSYYSQFREYRNHENGAEKNFIKKGLLLFSVNVVYLTVGLACVMILVNNNLARAFSIGAAIALVRFRVKFDQSSQTPPILFAIIGGIACGLNQVVLAWLALSIYMLITAGFTILVEKTTAK